MRPFPFGRPRAIQTGRKNGDCLENITREVGFERTRPNVGNDDHLYPLALADAKQQVCTEPQQPVPVLEDQAPDPAVEDEVEQAQQALLAVIHARPEIGDDLNIRPALLRSVLGQALLLPHEVVFSPTAAAFAGLAGS